MITLILLVTFAACISGIVANYYNDELITRSLFFVFCFILIILAAFRKIGVDQDSFGYLVYYNLDDGRMSLAAEPTFVAVAGVTRTVFGENGFRGLLIIYAVLGVSIKFIAIRRLTNLVWLSLITYISYYFLLHEFTQIRAGVASGLVLLSIFYAYHRRLVGFLVLIIAGSLFHYSALIALPIYFFRRDLTLSVKFLIGLAIPVAFGARAIGFDLLVVLPIEMVTTKIETYTAVSDAATVQLNVFNALYLTKYLVLYLFLLFGDRIAAKSTMFPLLLQTYAASLFIYIAFSFNIAVAMRISELFGVVEIVLFPMLVYAFRHRLIGLAAVLTLAIGHLGIGLFETELIQTSP